MIDGVDASTIQARVGEVRRQITDACARAGRSVDTVTLVAVSKTHPAEAVVQGIAAGLTDFGENRPQEAVEKIAQVGAGLGATQGAGGLPRWHMIGHVQSRKARLLVGRFALVHSIDSLRLADKLARLCQEQEARQDILLEMNVSGEASKSGFAATRWANSRTVRESLWSDIRSILTLSGVIVRGLMTMAPIVEDMEQARPVFADLFRLREALQTDFPWADWHELSMGMTDDFPVAITEGATLVRIGRAIFGLRQTG
jgi:pyridoxal phosphate enzyme (YggS family)